MDVKTSQPTTVYPSQPPFTGDHVLPLSHLDTDRNMNVPFRYVRAYAATNTHPNADPFDVITTALSTALIKYYPYTGSLHRGNIDGRFELHCTVGGGVQVIPATVDFPLSSVTYLDDADEEFIELLVPNPGQETRLTNLLVLQVTRFSCGGYTLGASVHHVLCDGLGATLFFNAMAELARGAGEVRVEPVWERSKLLGPREPARMEYPIEEFLCLDKAFEPYTELKEEKVVRQCFQLKDEWLDRFKISLQERSGLSFTTFEALGAFLWQARVKASKVPRDEKVKFAYAINIRKVVNPPLPAGYWGNGCVPMYVQLTAGDLIDRPIWETAKLIKMSKRNVTSEYVHSFIDFQELYYEKGINAGKWVSAFTDWRHLGHSTVDFGWGGPVTVLPLSRNILGSVEPCFFLPYSEASQGKKDGFKVLLYLRANAVAAFREEMEKFGNMEDYA